MQDDYVKILKCRYCGNHTNALALHKQLKPIREELYDSELCDRCKELFKTHRFFIAKDCLHSGFIKIEALKKILNEETFKRIGETKILIMDKCFACLSDHPIDSFEHL